MCADAALAGEYARLEPGLAAQHRDDRERCTDAKTEFVERVLRSIGMSGASEA